MKAKVHAVLMKCSINLCGTNLIKELNKPINTARWEKYLKEELAFDLSPNKEYRKNHIPQFHLKTYADLLIYGSYMEDQTKYKSDVEGPELENPVMKFCMGKIAKQGKYKHWLEHFWNDDYMEKPEKGLEITNEYICEVIADAFCITKIFGEFFGNVISKIMGLIGKPFFLLFNGSTTIEHFRPAPSRATEYWNILIKQYNEGNPEAAYFNLGKVCHLLADIWTPAHMHGDPHTGFKRMSTFIKGILKKNSNEYLGVADSMDDDQYEVYTNLQIEPHIPKKESHEDASEEWLPNIEEALPKRWCLSSDKSFPGYVSGWNLMDYFRHAANITMQYDSDDYDGKTKYEPYHWNHFRPLSPATWKLKRRWDGDLTDDACDQIASQLIPLIIADTAGVLYMFCDEVGMSFSNDIADWNDPTTGEERV